eukprot:m.59128 g.59128  ORF g.59128 m.59128 type:complete len:434 (+) comp12219_c0_seq1:289-1590(+)
MLHRLFARSLASVSGSRLSARVRYPKNNYDWRVPPSEFHPDEEENNAQQPGPEPTYHKIASGYKTYTSPGPFQCRFTDNANKGVLPSVSVAYETWGTLNEQRNNAVLIHTGLSATSHAASHQENTAAGWWELFVGPGKSIDTNKFFVICCNNLGSCFGSTGPSSINPATGKEYGTMFPLVTVEDMVRSQFLVLDSLGIARLHASVGSSLGGMQSLTAMTMFPDRVNSFVSISSAARAHPTSIALRYIQRRVLMADPHWRGGDYYGAEFPHMGMRHAREIATISYRSGPEWEQRFGRSRVREGPHSFCPDFLVETYLDHQGSQAAHKYDPNSLLYLSKAMDLFDVGELYGSFEAAIRRITKPALVIGVQSDILFPITQQRELAAALRAYSKGPVSYYELDSIYGHDTFLIDVPSVGAAVKGFLESSVSMHRVEA